MPTLLSAPPLQCPEQTSGGKQRTSLQGLDPGQQVHGFCTWMKTILLKHAVGKRRPFYDVLLCMYVCIFWWMTASRFFCKLCPMIFSQGRTNAGKLIAKVDFLTLMRENWLWRSIVGVCMYQFSWLSHALKGKPTKQEKILARKQSSIRESFCHNRRLQQREMLINQSQIIERLAALFPYWMLRELLLLGWDLWGWERGEEKFPSVGARAEILCRWNRSQRNGRG